MTTYEVVIVWLVVGYFLFLLEIKYLIILIFQAVFLLL